MISALKVKEVFYKEILPALDFCNYGITNETTLAEVKNLSKIFYASPEASSKRQASTENASAYRTSSKKRSFKESEESTQQSTFKLPDSTLITPKRRSRSSDHSYDRLNEKSINLSVEFMQVENQLSDNDLTTDHNNLSDPLQPSESWENFVDDNGGGVLFTSSQIEPSTGRNFMPMTWLPAKTSDVKKLESDSKTDSILAKMDLVFADSDDSDSLSDVEIKEAEKRTESEADSTTHAPKLKTKNVEFTSIKNESLKEIKQHEPTSPLSAKTPKKAKLDSDVTEKRCIAGTGIVFASSDDSDEETEEVQEKINTEADSTTQTVQAPFVQNVISIDEWLRKIESRARENCGKNSSCN